MNLSSKVTEVKFISGKYETLLEKLGIATIKDLITYFPRYYSDNSNITSIFDLKLTGNEEEKYTIKATVDDFKIVFLKTGRNIEEAVVHDDQDKIKCIFFNQTFLSRVFKKGKIFLIQGKIKRKGRTLTFYPTSYDEIIEGKENVHLGRVVPEYHLTEGISKKWFRNRIKSVIDNLDRIELNDEAKDILKGSLKILIRETHFPTNEESLLKAVHALALRELANIHLKLSKQKEKLRIFPPKIDAEIFEELFSEFKGGLDFRLTSDQEKILQDIFKIIKEGKSLNEIIQGDVGAGKTIIAIFLCLFFAKNNMQSVILAPTTILAKQHCQTFKKYLDKYGVSIELVTGEIKDTSSKQILIGTSAILARKLSLIKRPGLIVVDEQHRFGVEQREELLKPLSSAFDTSGYPHFINMTATPIPRTVAQVFFEDVTMHMIKIKPVGRKMIKTFVVDPTKKAGCYDWIRKELNRTHEQVYWVCPLITESEKTDLIAAEKTYKELTKIFPEFKIGLIHGQMKEKNEIMKKFQNNEINILVTTSVIEVGIDVPNATIMVVENAERFGLAQLHQIRGRVGRSDMQSWCFLFHPDNISTQSLERITFLAANHDGLRIAEYDLKLRGPGEIYGLRQSGIPNLKIAHLDDIELIKESKVLAHELKKTGVDKIELFS